MVVVPTYNERDNVERLIAEVLAQDEGIEALVVDDNSPDGTGEVVERMKEGNPRLHLLRRPGKLGLGSAYRDGFRFALARGVDYIIEMDADFSHDPAMLPVFLDKIKNYDLVIGSRYLNGVSVVNWPLRRLMLSCFANLYTRLITGLRISDCTVDSNAFAER
jgi:dolichol-phosphate mannosyltransferase